MSLCRYALYRPGLTGPVAYDRDVVVLLSDWSFAEPMTLIRKLKKRGGYFNFQRRTAGDLFAGISRQGLAATISERMLWSRMRRDPTDFADVTGYTYFDVRIPGLRITLVQAEDRAYTVFAETMDRSGYARGTLAPRPGMAAALPARRPREPPTSSLAGESRSGVGPRSGRIDDLDGRPGRTDSPFGDPAGGDANGGNRTMMGHQGRRRP